MPFAPQKVLPSGQVRRRPRDLSRVAAPTVLAVLVGRSLDDMVGDGQRDLGLGVVLSQQGAGFRGPSVCYDRL